MLSHNQSKHLRSLAVKKYRQLHGQFLVEGDKMVLELLGQTRMGIVSIFATESWLERNASAVHPFSGLVFPVSETELAKISTLSTPNQVLAVATYPVSAPGSMADLPSKTLCFYLDGIQDPGNLGSILRVADWFGFPAVFCSPDSADVFNPKVVQASMGAIFRVQTAECGLAELLSAAPQIPVSGAVLDGENLFEVELPKNGLLLIGNEGRGISPESERLLSHRFCIPRHPEGGAESLNAAVAAGIMAAAFRRFNR